MSTSIALRALAIALFLTIFLAHGVAAELKPRTTAKHTTTATDDESDGTTGASPSTSSENSVTTSSPPYTTTEITVTGTVTKTTTRVVTARPTHKASAKGWNYIGCYNETVQLNGTGGARTLAGGPMEGTDNMTVEICLNYCKGNQYAGLEYARECWCSPYISTLASLLPEENCSMACIGNTSEACGNSWALSVYEVQSAARILASDPAILIGALLTAILGASVLL